MDALIRRNRDAIRHRLAPTPISRTCYTRGPQIQRRIVFDRFEAVESEVRVVDRRSRYTEALQLHRQRKFATSPDPALARKVMDDYADQRRAKGQAVKEEARRRLRATR